MRVDLTTEQAEAFDHPLYVNDNALRDFPIPEIHSLGETETGFAFAHPEVTWVDELVIQFLLDERVDELQAIDAAPVADRPAMRQEIRERSVGRTLGRSEDRPTARVEMRLDLRQETRIATRIAARQAELDVDSTPG